MRLCVLALVLHATTARAQSTLDQFEPALLPEDGLALGGARLLAPRGWALSLTADYARAPLSYELGPPANLQQRVVSDHLVLHLGGAFAVHRRVTLFASLPVHAMMRGEPILLRSARPEGAGVGDVRVGARIGLLERSRGALAAELVARLPSAELTNRDQLYSGDAVGSYDAVLAGELRVRIVDLRARLGVRLRKEVELANLALGSALLFSAGGRVRIDAHWSALLELDASSYFSALFASDHTPLELLLGAKYTRSSVWAAVGAGPGLSRGYGSPDYRVLATFGYAGTGRSERVVVPTTAEVRPADPCAAQPDAPGCPAYDEDRDGVVSARDACPSEAEDGVDGDGCPEAQLAEAPAQPVVDCANEPEATAERCRELAAPAEDAVQATPSSGESVAFGRVEYAVGKGSALASSISTLLAVRSILAHNPQLLRVRVEGHSDDIGNPEYNQFLARRRVRAVARWLIERGIEAGRLEAFACGDRYPREPDPERKGLQANRRVEFHVVDPPGTPHGHDECEPVPLAD